MAQPPHFGHGHGHGHGYGQGHGHGYGAPSGIVATPGIAATPVDVDAMLEDPLDDTLFDLLDDPDLLARAVAASSASRPGTSGSIVAGTPSQPVRKQIPGAYLWAKESSPHLEVYFVNGLHRRAGRGKADRRAGGRYGLAGTTEPKQASEKPA